MPRKKLIRTNLHPYHITIRSNNREWFDLPLQVVWNICMASLKISNTKYPVKLQAFVLMSNHYHLMLWTPNADLDKFMYVLNSSISKLMREQTGRINRIFGDRYKWSLIDDIKYYQTCLKYIYQNPLKAKIIQRCEDYKYSSIYYVSRNCDVGIDWHDPYMDSDEAIFFDWINTVESNSEEVGKALQKSVFKMPKNRSSRRLI